MIEDQSSVQNLTATRALLQILDGEGHPCDRRGESQSRRIMLGEEGPMCKGLRGLKRRGKKSTEGDQEKSCSGRIFAELTEAEDIKKRWQEYTEELYKKDLHDPYNHNGVITHLESDILECEVKWALESITMNKASGGDGIPVELFQILKDDAVKVLQ